MDKIIIDSKDEIKIIMKNLNSINQIMKNIRNDKTYTISNGRAFAPPNQNYDEKNNNKNCGWHYANIKMDLPHIDQFTFTVNGSEYYSFYKEHKNDVKEIHIIDDSIIFYTMTDLSIGKYNLLIKKDSQECKEDIEKIKKYLQTLIDLKNKYNSTSKIYEAESEFIHIINNIDQLPQTVIFNDKYKLRFTKKLLPVLNKSSKLKYEIYDLETLFNNNYFIIQFTTERKELDMIDAYACINY